MKKEKKLGILAAVFALALGGATVSHAALVLDEVKGDGTTINVSEPPTSGTISVTVSAITDRGVGDGNTNLVTGGQVYSYIQELNLGTEYTGSDTITIDENTNAISVKNMTQGADGSLSLGYHATASGNGALAVGGGTEATGAGAVALGATSKAEATNASAVGVDNHAYAYQATAVGYHNKAGDANGTSSNFATAMGSENTAVGYYNVALGGANDATGSMYSSAVGIGNESSGSGASAFGYLNVASGTGSSAIGGNNEAGALRAVAMGTSNKALGQDSSAMGASNKVYGTESAAFGYNNTVGAATKAGEGEIVIETDKGNNTYVFGANNTVTANDAIVVGTNVTTVANNSVVIGNGSTSEEEDTVSVGTKGSERKIVHVKDGTEKTDAATYGQIAKNDTYEVKDGKVVVETNAGGTAFTITGIGTSSADIGDTKKLVDAGLGDNVVDSVLNVNDKIGNLSDDINKVGAGAAALAALHPEGFDPADKWSFAVGYGHYKSANAGALGAFYKPNFDTTLSVGGTIGNGNSMLNAGVSFKLGQRGARLPQNASNPQLVQEVNALRAENASQAKEIAALRADNEQMKRQIATILSKMEISD